jgi:hypothetical protein
MTTPHISAAQTTNPNNYQRIDLAGDNAGGGAAVASDSKNDARDDADELGDNDVNDDDDEEEEDTDTGITREIMPLESHLVELKYYMVLELVV